MLFWGLADNSDNEYNYDCLNFVSYNSNVLKITVDEVIDQVALIMLMPL